MQETTDEPNGKGAAPGGGKATIVFDDKSVRAFLIASVGWGLVAMLVGVIAALQLNFWEMNGKWLEWVTGDLINFFLPESMHIEPLFQADGVQYITFGRLRPLHTNAAIFAFVGNMMFAGIYYSTQRLCKARMASDLLSKIHFWGWQFIILCAAITLPMGYTRGKEYAELIWPINLMVAVIWLIFAWNFFWTLKKRNERSLYVALWFYIATIVTVTMLYVVNHLQLPTSLTHSYPIFGGVQDALVQWWYGHNAVAFFLTTPILGIMYYFMPKAANRPVYSYRLSIVHFWSLVFIYIWAGPHHLLNTGLPDWLQTLGMLFSLMLWAPSWGGMLNGLLTLRGAWDKLRTDPVIKFFVVAITFYGMATFEGPLLSIRAVNTLSHYTDWTIGHVHSGTLGWNGFMAAGMFYWLVPRLWNTKLFSTAMANFHFWIGTFGIVLYVGSMWVSGIMQVLLLNATIPGSDGTLLANEFVETVDSIQLSMLVRAIGGGLYLLGFIIMAINLWLTAKSGKAFDESREVVLLEKKTKDRMTWKEALTGDPIVCTWVGLLLLCVWILIPGPWGIAFFVLTVASFLVALNRFRKSKRSWAQWYERLCENYMPFTVLTLLAAVIGGVIQIVPTVIMNRADNVEGRIQVLYTPLELAGRDIYVSEGCYNCHSQMIRTLKPDIMRYADAKSGYSRLGDSIYDHPFQWGSKRTGPDLAQEGGNRPDAWHYQHMLNPRDVVSASTMPAYPWLFDEKYDLKILPTKIATQRRIGVPYEAMTGHEIQQSAIEQGLGISERLMNSPQQIYVDHDKKIVALIAYLQKLGTFKPVNPAVEEDPKADEAPKAAKSPDAPPAGEGGASASLENPDPERQGQG